jgi:hypothetical protein
MSGGTLTPPRDPTWDTEALIAPVIPFRQRGEQPDQPVRDDPKANPPIAAALADKPSSSWIHQGNGLLVHNDAAARLGNEANVPRPRHARRLLVGALIAVAISAGAATALALSDGGQPHAAPPARPQTAASTRSVGLASRRDEHSTAATARKPVRPATTAKSKHSTAAAHQRSTGSAVTHSATAPPTSTRGALSPNPTGSAACVPGELGC